MSVVSYSYDLFNCYIYIYIYDGWFIFLRLNVPLLLTFRQVFRKPSGSFRTAGFEHLTYGATYKELLWTHFSYLRAVTCRQPWPRTFAALKKARLAPWLQMPCKLPGGFRQASGNLPGKSLTQLLQIRRQPYRAEQGQRTYGLTHLRTQLSQSSLPTPSGKSSGNLPEASGLQVKS